MAKIKKPKKRTVVCTGKRKTSIARATCKEGKGIVRINSLNLNLLTPETARLRIMEPLILAGEKASKVNISVNVSGGGVMSRADAARVAISNALVNYFADSELKKTFQMYDKKMLVSDTRRTEPQKPYRSAARSKRQTSKR